MANKKNEKLEVVKVALEIVLTKEDMQRCMTWDIQTNRSPS